jgi:hypothetical protein
MSRRWFGLAGEGCKQRNFGVQLSWPVTIPNFPQSYIENHSCLSLQLFHIWIRYLCLEILSILSRSDASEDFKSNYFMMLGPLRMNSSILTVMLSHSLQEDATQNPYVFL